MERHAYRLDTRTEQTASVRGTWLATRHLLFREIKLCRLLIDLYDPHAYTPMGGHDGHGHPPSLTPPVKHLSQEHSVSHRDCGGGRGRGAYSKQQRVK